MSRHRRGQQGRLAAQGSWDSYPQTRRFQALWVTLGLLCAMPGLAATYLRLTEPTDDAPALFASFIPYAVLAYLPALLFFVIGLVRARRRIGLGVVACVTAALLACHLYWLAPFFVSDDRPSDTPGFTLMTLNTLYGAADPERIVSQGRRADVVVLLEETTAGLGAIKARGWDQRFPHSVGVVGGGIGDTVIFSRYPITAPASLPQSKFQQWVVTVAPPGLSPVRLIAAHPCNPYCGGNQFELEHQDLRSEAVRNLNAPLILVGDLNAVDDHAPLLALRRDGLRSVVDVAGAGWVPTFPANRRFPPLLPIDHILVNRFLTATDVHTFQVDDTDHLGLMATIAGAK